VSPTLRIMGVTRLAQNPHPPPKLARYSPDIYSPRFIPALGAAISPPPDSPCARGQLIAINEIMYILGFFGGQSLRYDLTSSRDDLLLDMKFLLNRLRLRSV